MDPVEDEIILKTHDARMERWKKRMASRASSEEERLSQSMDAYIERMKSPAHVMNPPDQAITSTSYNWPDPPPQSSPTQQCVVEETTHDSTVTKTISGEEAEMRIGETMIEEVEPTTHSKEVEDDPMSSEMWWENLEEPNYEGGEFDSDGEDYLFFLKLREDMESNKDEETMMYEEKPP